MIFVVCMAIVSAIVVVITISIITVFVSFLLFLFGCCCCCFCCCCCCCCCYGCYGCYHYRHIMIVVTVVLVSYCYRIDCDWICGKPIILFPVHINYSRYGEGLVQWGVMGLCNPTAGSRVSEFCSGFQGRPKWAHHSHTQRLKRNSHCCWEFCKEWVAA